MLLAKGSIDSIVHNRFGGIAMHSHVSKIHGSSVLGNAVAVSQCVVGNPPPPTWPKGGLCCHIMLNAQAGVKMGAALCRTAMRCTTRALWHHDVGVVSPTSQLSWAAVVVLRT